MQVSQLTCIAPDDSLEFSAPVKRLNPTNFKIQLKFVDVMPQMYSTQLIFTLGVFRFSNSM